MIGVHMHTGRPRKSYQPPVHKFLNDLMNSSLSDVADQEFEASRPSVNVFEAKDAYHLEFAVPGLSKSDFSIKVEDDVLIISANKNSEPLTEGKFLRKEFNYNSFSRRFKLHDQINQDQISAGYEAGVLTVTLPKRAKEEPRKINIQ